ncbi:MAG: chemotaxis signal transduction protein [Arenicella sp.]|jgi:chemotaxis signal transduction protein
MPENTCLNILTTMRQQAIELAAQGLSYVSQSAGIKNIAFVVNNVHYYCEASQIKEVSVCEKLVLVPQTKRWMRGLINSKGVLYSVSDLSLFAGFDRPIQASKGHLLLLNDEQSQSSLLVNRVVGFRYFDVSQKLKEIESKQNVMDGLSSYVSEGYHTDGLDWYGLDIARLLASEQYREIQ